MRHRADAALLLLALAACGPSREDLLRQEILELRQARVERSAVEKARQEADDAVAQLAAHREDLEVAVQEADALEAQVAELDAAFQAELARNQALRDAIAAAQDGIRLASERAAKLDEQIATIRLRASWARRQAETLAREIRPEDPAWARERRLAALDELLAELAQEYPDDPLLAELARPAPGSAAVSAAAADGAGPQGGADGSSLAHRVSDHFAQVYDLDRPAPGESPPGQAAAPPEAVGAGAESAAPPQFETSVPAR